MESILRVRDKDGNIIDIPAIRGADGKTPVKGIDYFTEDEINEFIKTILDSLPKVEEDEF